MFSVITTAYNDSKYVNVYLDSICHQTMPPSEIIIVDGGSMDNTCELIEQYSKHSNILIKCIKRGRLNIAQAFNIGIKESTNDYIVITCMGNNFSKTMCEDLYSSIRNTEYDAAYGLLFGVDNGKISRLYNKVYIKDTGNEIMSNRCVIYRRDVFEKIGFFIENFKYAGEDAEFLCRFERFNLKKKLVNKPTVFWETPNSLKAFKKQRKDYAIAELQYAGIKYCFFTRQQIKWYFIICAIILTPLSIYFLLLGLLYLIYSFIQKVRMFRSFEVAIFSEYGEIIKNVYYFKNFKYCTSKYRVSY